MSIRRLIPMWLVLMLAAVACPVQAQGEKKGNATSAEDAYRTGVAYLKLKNLAKGQEALEAALTLAPDDKLRGQIQRALLVPYDKAADYTKFLAASEFVIRHPNSPAEKSSSRTDVISFLQDRNKEREGADRYEMLLQKDPKDAAVLYILSGIYSDLLRNPKRAAELTELLAQATKDAGQVDSVVSAHSAAQFVKSGRWQEGAALYEKTAESDDKNKAQYLKEAAVAWLKAGEKEKARAAARAASKVGFKSKTRSKAHFWNRSLGDVFLETGEYPLAIQHLERALELTTVEGYRRDCQKKLEQAKQKGKI